MKIRGIFNSAVSSRHRLRTGSDFRLVSQSKPKSRVKRDKDLKRLLGRLRQFRAFDDFLLPPEIFAARQCKDELWPAVSGRFDEWRAERVGLLESRLQEIDAIASDIRHQAEVIEV